MMYKILILRVKKTIIFFTLIFLIISQTNIGVVYAQSVAELEAQKDASIEVLDKTEIVVDKVIEKLDEKINDKREDRLREKEEEIEDYIEEVQDKIQKENSSSDVKALVREAKKVVVLKVVSGATEYEDVADAIPSDVANTASEKIEAVETIQESMETKSGDYSILIKTKYTQSQLKTLFDKFDKDIVLDLMYSDSGEDYYEVFIDEDSIFRQEMLEDIESGNLPENFFGVQIIFPEVFSIGSLDGENLTQTWGVESYKTYQYLDDIDASIKVGVVDTGIDYNHPDLSSNVSGGYDFVNDDSDAMDDQGHGTHVAGTIAANINESGIIGVNPEADLVPLKICNARGFCPSYAVLRALDYAKSENIDILNMSLGGRGTVSGHPICAGISAYTDAGGIVVSASGNSNIDTSQFVPGGCSDAITVAAVDSSGNRASFSNYGAKVDVSAPGVSVYSTYPGNQYKSLSGTSMATPHIAGLVSLIQSQDDNITTSEVKALLKKYPSAVSTTGGKSIASAVDIAGVMNRFNEVEVVEVVVEESEELVEEIPEEVVEVVESDDSNFDRDIIIPNKPGPSPEKDTSVDDDEDWVLENPFSVSKEIPTIDFGEIEEIIEINSDNSNLEKIEIDLLQETKKASGTSAGGQVFDDQGNLILDAVEINSDEELIRLEPVDSFDMNNYSEGVDIANNEDYIEEEELPVELFIDGAERGVQGESSCKDERGCPGVEINSLDDGEELIFEIEELSQEQVFLDEEGNGVDFDDLEKIDLTLEEDIESGVQINTTSNLEPIVIPGIGGNIEINSLGDNEFIEIEEVVVGEIVIEEGEELDAHGVEINSFVEEYIDDDGGIYEDSFDFLGLEEEIGEYVEEVSIEEEVIQNTLLENEPEGIEINNIDFGNTIDAMPTEIRYIRDWLSGSNKNGGNFWVEIQAIETDTGNNVALGKNVIGTREENPVHPYARVTDGNSSTNPYSYGGGSLQNVMVDLGSSYSLDLVRVWHYYGDKRTFNKTKTEVSADGVNWYVLFDSEVEGTYSESAGGKTHVLDRGISTLPTEIRYVRDWVHGSDGSTSNIWKEIEVLERSTGENKALGIMPTTDIGSPTGNLLSLTDGSISTGWTGKSYGKTHSYMKLDLGELYEIGMIKVWHYYDGRTFNKTKTEVSADGVNWYVLFDSEVEGTYVEERNGIGRTYELRNTVTEKPSEIRYIRDHANGSNRNGGSHWIELQAYDETGTNIAKGKPVISKYPLNDDARPFSRLTDGGLSYRTSAKYHDGWLQVDLGETYNLEMLKVWHYYYDGVGNTGPGRIYNGTKTEVSTDGVNWYVLHDSEIDGTYVEPQDKTGKIYRLTDDPVQKTCVTNVGRDCHFLFHHASSFDFEIVDDSKVSVISSSGSFKLEGVAEGKTKVSVSKDGVTYYEIDVEVLPSHQTHIKNISIGQFVSIQVPNAELYSLSVSNGGIVSYQRNASEIQARGINAGNTKLYLKYKGILVATIDIIVDSHSIETRELIFYADKVVREDLRLRFQRVYFEPTSSEIGLVDVYTNGKYWYFSGKSGGDVEVYMKNRQTGEHLLTYKITILPIPEPIVYTLDLFNGNGGYVYLPENIENYTITESGEYSNFFDKKRQYDDKFYLRPQKVGTHSIHLKDKKTGYDKYRIDIISKLQEGDLTLVVTEYKEVSSQDRHISEDSSIARISGGDEILGVSPGKTDINRYDDGVHERVTHVTVLPIPDPIEINCTVYIGETCRLDYYHGGRGIQYITSSRDIEVEYGTKTLRVEGDVSGTATVYVRANKANYTKYKMNVTVIPKPVKTFECTMPVGTECQTRWWDEVGEYTITTSDTSIVDVDLYRYTQEFSGGNRTMEKTVIRGAKEGIADVYIYEKGEHIATIVVTVSPPIPPISVEDGSITLRQGESISVDILSGGGDYKVVSSDKDVISFSVDNNSDEPSQVDISGRTPGKTYPVFRDKYYQEYTMSINITDATLDIHLPPDLSVVGNNVIFDNYNPQYISATNFHTDVNYTKSNNNIRVTKEIIDDDLIAFLITPVQNGETDITFTDGEGNVEEYVIEVGGSNTDNQEAGKDEGNISMQGFANKFAAILQDAVVTTDDIGVVNVDHQIFISSDTCQGQQSLISDNTRQAIHTRLNLLSESKRSEVYIRTYFLLKQHEGYEFNSECISLIGNRYLGSYVYSMAKEFSDYTQYLYEQDIEIKLTDIENIAFQNSFPHIRQGATNIKNSFYGVKNNLNPYQLISLYRVFKGRTIDEIIADIDTDARYVATKVSAPIVLNAIVEFGDSGIELPYTGDSFTNFRVATPMLQTFVDKTAGDKVCEYYEHGKNQIICYNQNTFYTTNHLISQEVKKHHDYIKYKNIALDSLDQYNLNTGDKVLVGYGSDGNFSSGDLYYSIHLYNWRVYLEKGSNGKLYSIVEIFDDYNFPEDARFGESKSDTLNAIGYYYETNLFGQTYDFIIQIREPIN